VEKNYEILFGAKKELFTTGDQSSAVSFRTKIYVDGQKDRSLRLINKAVKMKKDGFIGEKRKKTALMFDLSKWVENDSENIEKEETQNDDGTISVFDDDIVNNEKKPNQNKFGYGAVSVYFFNAKDFDKNETVTGNPIPLAALHLHYRPTQWLLERDILAKEEPIEIFDETQVIKEVDDTVQQHVQQVKLHPGRHKNVNEEPDDDDCDISEWTGKLILGDVQEVVVENQEAKKKSRSKKKQNTEKVKNEIEESVDNDFDTGKLTVNDVQEVVEENQGTKKKSRSKKEKNVEKVKNKIEESADNDCDAGKSPLNDVQEVVEENQGAKKKSRGRKVKKNVEKVEEPADDGCDAGKSTHNDVQEVVEENQEAKRKSRDRKEKKNVEKVKNEIEESADNDCDKGKLNLNDVQEVVEENQGAKKKSRDRKVKKNVEEVEEPTDDDCEISELTENLTLDDTQHAVEENQETEKKSRGKKEKKVENVAAVNRYNLRPRNPVQYY
jgi:hypothetical protein